MHFLFGMRGIKHACDRMINDLQAQYYSMKIINHTTGKEETIYVQGALRPIMLFEYVFPDEHLNEVYNTIMSQNKIKDSKYTKFNKFLWMIRKAMGFKEIPEIPETPMRIIANPDVHIFPIGIKEDLKEVPNKGGFTSEAL